MRRPGPVDRFAAQPWCELCLCALSTAACDRALPRVPGAWAARAPLPRRPYRRGCPEPRACLCYRRLSGESARLVGGVTGRLVARIRVLSSSVRSLTEGEDRYSESLAESDSGVSPSAARTVENKERKKGKCAVRV